MAGASHAPRLMCLGRGRRLLFKESESVRVRQISAFGKGNYPGEGKYDWRYIPRVNEGTYYVNTTKTSNVSIVYDGRGTKDVGTGFGVRA